MTTLVTQARLHTRLFLNTLDGMDADAGTFRIAGRTNNAAFIAAHLVESRDWTARLLGLEGVAPFGGALAYGASIDTLADLPGLDAIRHAWGVVSPGFEARLASLTPEELTAPAVNRFPVDDPTVAGTLAFLMHHEAYHIGQLSLLRRAVGLDPMRYR